MYDLPPEFHFGLLGWAPEGERVWPEITGKIPDYPGGLNLQHRIEYWLTLDLLSSRIAGRTGPCAAAARVLDSSDADVVFVPFFSSLSFNRHSKVIPPLKVSRNRMLQDKLVEFLTSRDEWRRSGGRDHVILAHHPNSKLDARLKLWPCMFILSDFGRYPPAVANVEKDVIAPYKHVIGNFVNDSSGYDDRPTLLYFQGSIYRKDMQSRSTFSSGKASDHSYERSSIRPMRYNEPEDLNPSQRHSHEELPDTWFKKFAEKYKIRQHRFPSGEKEPPKRTAEGMSTYLRLRSAHKRKRQVFKDDRYAGLGDPSLENGNSMRSKIASDVISSADEAFFPELMFPSDCIPDNALLPTTGIENQKMEVYGVLDNLPPLLAEAVYEYGRGEYKKVYEILGPNFNAIDYKQLKELRNK